MKRTYSLLTLLMIPVLAFCQYDADSWDSTFRESGKIYVVVAVVLLIVLALIGYLVSQDRRISKIEKEINK